ncbi:MAG: I78 family peptidase inhibitor [Parvularcula sp.]|jgi:hypothetical protein|nr:I78 family peptidase inhibitor [Parvularcula sp.]
MTRLALLSAATLIALTACGADEAETESPVTNFEQAEEDGRMMDDGDRGSETMGEGDGEDIDDALVDREPTGECPADEYQGFVGAQLAAVTYPRDLNVRIIEPGQMYTQEYRADRMNFHLDEDGVITKVICG